MAKPIAYYDPARQLVRVEKIDDILPIAKADRLELAVIGGWQVIVAKGSWKIGDHVLYCEVGSLLPLTVPEFFSAARDNVKSFGEDYAYIKTFKLRGAIGQGYICKIPEKYANEKLGTDLTVQLGVLKYEANPTPDIILNAKLSSKRKLNLIERAIAFISGDPVSNLLPFPEEELSKSGETRVQNSMRELSAITEETDGAELSVKFDGSSMSILASKDFLDNSPVKLRLCSHNSEISLSVVEVGFIKACRLFIGGSLSTIYDRIRGNARFYWPKFQLRIPVSNSAFTRVLAELIARGLENKVNSHYSLTGEVVSFQGELIGPGVTAGDRVNYEGVSKDSFYVYRVFVNGEEVSPTRARELTKQMDLEYVPVIDVNFKVRNYVVKTSGSQEMINVKQLVELAKGERALAKGGHREGLVLKFNNVPVSAKIINPDFLLENGDA